ncbi:PEP/pyruvate-binding domain-containing protein [uncultured Ilyobacter sp.]|uniref:PEP/pyruvate-binding domain-containing protein n=1 Tax=uncultured Ilyobacter sp. TaxID=544433 RepID=UPI0029F4E743|nr:PEP/pyruvate-binding domain-containing protein [uncultured Ilyobacter sp.]
MSQPPNAGFYPPFDRRFFDGDEEFTVIGGGELGGKALGLASAKHLLERACPGGNLLSVQIGIPRLTVLGTEVFEQFMAANNLYDVATADLPDERIAHAFLNAELPPAYVGDLRALVGGVHTPLAVRSSSRLEDALQHPFAGVYATKMIPNNESAIGDRFKKLSEAVKFVWASTFFGDAKRYMHRINHPLEDERMAVVIQEVVGDLYGERYYPVISGVIRTHNYYASGPAEPEDGVVNLAVGLGKTIVDGGVTWTYCPRYPNHRPPYGSTRELLKNTQTQFWAVNMTPAAYDPVNEAECLVQAGLDVAEWDDVLRFTASTYDAQSDRLVLGTGIAGPRAITFGRLLELGEVPLNGVIEHIAQHAKESLQADVEIEFALTLDRQRGLPARFGFLQVRPMMVPREQVDVNETDLHAPNVLLACDTVLGNGESRTITDVVYVKPATFDAKHTAAIAIEIADLNYQLEAENRPYVLIGFGRWGSSDPWLGIPATWPQISGARVIVESTLPTMNVDASQGSHFFHNMISFGVHYFTVRHTSSHGIDWSWLDRQPSTSETPFLRHVRLPEPLTIRVDGRHGRGVILHA